MGSDREFGIRDLRNHTSRVIEAVEQGDAVYLTRRGERIARIEPVRPDGGATGWGARFLSRLDATGVPDLSDLRSLFDGDDLATIETERGVREVVEE
ncbi:type II toxin-antitoxin system prevent-host-death family antitoxin [Iamia sp.]|uniref:type II toxin-antitoxin system Phd/YefM family antitoxin n=1 Tax=Iamia sp. TaxID=2722710 RepID=UPI002C137C37|nr:type II toxin-antitoxin system prevent-host-death family antitoxin [Iamia sp.]HXH59353.1 type II toxin-antitoxin system prevent-host-death family antitoxin [Iamia sp.]